MYVHTLLSILFVKNYPFKDFAGGLITILPKQIREIKFVLYGSDNSGLIICTILTMENVKIIDREIIESMRSYQLYKFNDFYVIQPAGKNFVKLYHVEVIPRNTFIRQDPVFGFL